MGAASNQFPKAYVGTGASELCLASSKRSSARETKVSKNWITYILHHREQQI